MAEVFGVAGAVNIAATFSAVIEVFDYTSQLKLTLLRLRLSRWGEAVDIYNDPQLGDPSAGAAELQAAKDTLLQILVLFEASHKISKKFAARNAGGAPPGPAAEDDVAALEGDFAALAVDNKMKALAKKRQKGSSIARLTSWAIHHSTALKTLIADISALADDLETLFPAPKQRTDSLARDEVARVKENEGEVRALATASEGLDTVMHEAATAARGGHTFRGVEISDAAAVQNGDAYYANFDCSARGALPSGASHLFEGVRITGNGKTVVLNGDRYGGADPFAS